LEGDGYGRLRSYPDHGLYLLFEYFMMLYQLHSFSTIK